MARLVEIARFTDDVKGVADWYRAVLGIEPARETKELAEFDLGGVTLRIHKRHETRPDGLPAEDHLALAVSDLDARCAELRGKGARIEIGPSEYPWGRSAYLRDADGRLVELLEGS